jgi:hypothetical protein
MATQTVVIGGPEPVGEAKIASQSTRLEGTQPARAEPWVNASQEKTHQEPTLMAGRGALIRDTVVSRETKEHTECFTCSRIFFGRLFEQCPRCGSQSLQHYPAGELNLLARPGDVGFYLVPRSRREPSYETG